MSDITSSFITIDPTFLTHFQIISNNTMYNGNQITTTMLIKKINEDSSNSHKIGNIATQYRPNSQIQYVYTYNANIPPHYITETNSHNIDIDNTEKSITIESNGDLFIRPNTSYKNNSMITFNFNYTTL